jgi:ketosteroid isomerase-like protein
MWLFSEGVSYMRLFLITLTLVCSSMILPAAAQAPANEEASVAAAVKVFHGAYAAGNAAQVMQFIHEDAMMMEGGNIETRAQYEKDHLPADIAFEKEVQAKRMPVRVVVRGDTAWVTTSADFVGTFQGKPVDFQGLELMVLSREPAGWRIRAIHWSSRNRRPPQAK